jgi:PKD repeat protein
VFARAWFSPFIRHAYRSPGTYNLTVTAADQNGQTDSMTLPIHVYPALRVRIVTHGCRPMARVSGGDGTVLTRRWARRHGRLQITVTDAAGGIASASRRVAGAVCKAPPRWRTS